MAARSAANQSPLVRIGVAVAGLVVLLYAVEGGEYGTSDLFHLRARQRALVTELKGMHHEIDSLSAYAHAVETDPVVQEQIAREEFGMVRGTKELLYRFAPPPDTTTHASAHP